ncbi:MAG: hypothetical protein JW958_05770 [Candidatus Eisenbacteria bacterium]|nr:hypothetical protein [Candidatus Eisenbacteria bacterium]
MRTVNALLFLSALLAAALVSFGGCGDNAFDPKENRAPETGLALTGDSLSTTIYRVNLKWWGSDLDGEVHGYEYRWIPLQGLTETYELDTAWTYTAFVKKNFVLPVPDANARFRFEVRAMDDEGKRDPTPATQEYPFYNNRPSVSIRYKSLLPDSAWPVLTFGWDSADPDGDSTIAKHLIWVGGREESPMEVDAELDTILLLPAQLDTSGWVTVFLQTVDEAHSASDPDSFDVKLYPIHGEILLVDDYSLNSAGFVDADSWYKDFLIGRVQEDGFTRIDLAKTPFNTDVRFGGFLTAFNHVIWYSGHRARSVFSDEQRFTQMGRAEKGLGTFLERGGGLFLSSLNAIGTYSGFTPNFYKTYAGFDTVFIDTTPRTQTFSNFAFREGIYAYQVPLEPFEGTGLPQLRAFTGLRYHGLDSPVDTTATFAAERLYKIPNGNLQGQAADFTVVLRRDLPAPGGRLVLSTIPFAFYYGEGNNDEVFGAFLDWLGAPAR